MKPVFEILADEKRITDLIKGRLISLVLTDEAGFESDTVEVALDNRDLKIEPPSRGVELRVSLGFQQSGVRKMGLFVVDEYERSGMPHRMIIRARSAWGGSGKNKSRTLNGIETALKAQRSRSFEGATLQEVVNAIAADCGLEPRVHPDLAGEQIIHIDQTDEGNAHFLRRMARDRDAVFKVAGGMLLFVPEAQAKTALGSTIPTVYLSLYEPTNRGSYNWVKLSGEPDSYRITVAERENYQSVVAYYHDVAAAERKAITAGSGDPVRTLRGNYPSASEAGQAAAAELRRIGRGESAPTFNLEGNPLVAAEGWIVVDDTLGSDLEGAWGITRAVHTLDEVGYRTSVECESVEA